MLTSHPIVYHPRIVPELCSGKHRQDHSGAETDPNAHHHGIRIVGFGSAMPTAIVDEGIENVKKDPKKFAMARARMVDCFFKDYELAKITEKTLREKVRSVMSLEIVPREKDDKTDNGPYWAYAITVDNPMYPMLFQGMVSAGVFSSASHSGATIMMPVDMMHNNVRHEAELAKSK